MPIINVQEAMLDTSRLREHCCKELSPVRNHQTSPGTWQIQVIPSCKMGVKTLLLPMRAIRKSHSLQIYKGADAQDLIGVVRYQDFIEVITSIKPRLFPKTS